MSNLEEQKDKDKALEALKQTKGDLDKALEELRRTKGDLDKAAEAAKSLKQDLAEEREKTRDLERELSELEAEFDESRSKVVSFEARELEYARMSKDYAKLRGTLDDAALAIKEEGRREKKLKARLAAAHRCLADEQSLRMRAENQPALAKECGELRARIAFLEREMRAAEARNSLLATERDDLKQQLAQPAEQST
jgi:chromosome segregation ATPase